MVKSAKDRSFEAIRTSVGKIRNHIKINDWNGIQADFDECNKHVDKSKVWNSPSGIVGMFSCRCAWRCGYIFSVRRYEFALRFPGLVGSYSSLVGRVVP